MKRLDTNIYETEGGFIVRWRDVDGRRVKRFGPDTSLAALQAFRDERDRLAQAPDAEGFRADAARYLVHPQVAAMPGFKTRQFEIAKWVAIFGDTPRDAIDTSRIDAELQTLSTEGYANATVNKFRTALMHVWTRLDGRSAANPVRDAMMFEEAKMTPRGQPYELLTRILDDIADERGIAFDRATLYREVWREPATVVAARYHVSSTFLCRVCRKLAVPTPPRGYWARATAVRPPRPPLPRSVQGPPADLLKSRARLEVLTWTGMDPGQLMRMNPAEDLDLVECWYTPPFRRKGSRRRRTPRAVMRLPLVPDAVKAFERLMAVDGWGPFCTRSLAKVWQRACRRVEAQIRAERKNPRFRLPHIRVKDLRHSFGTRVYEDTGNLTTVAQMLQHAPGSPMTIRYALGAVPTVLQAQMLKFSGGRKSHQVIPFSSTGRGQVGSQA